MQIGPPKKKKTVWLEDQREMYGGFRVLKLQNSIDFKIGQELHQKEVRELLQSREWTVKIFK